MLFYANDMFKLTLCSDNPRPAKQRKLTNYAAAGTVSVASTTAIATAAEDKLTKKLIDAKKKVLAQHIKSKLKARKYLFVIPCEAF